MEAVRTKTVTFYVTLLVRLRAGRKEGEAVRTKTVTFCVTVWVLLGVETKDGRQFTPIP